MPVDESFMLIWGRKVLEWTNSFFPKEDSLRFIKEIQDKIENTDAISLLQNMLAA